MYSLFVNLVHKITNIEDVFAILIYLETNVTKSYTFRGEMIISIGISSNFTHLLFYSISYIFIILVLFYSLMFDGEYVTIEENRRNSNGENPFFFRSLKW
jgi:hypothetical protein